LRRRVEAELREMFPGGARVGGLEGSLFGALTVRDVELDRDDGRPLVTIGLLRADLALWPLVTRTARVDELVMEDVRVVAARAGRPRRRGASSFAGWRSIAHRSSLRSAPNR